MTSSVYNSFVFKDKSTPNVRSSLLCCVVFMLRILQPTTVHNTIFYSVSFLSQNLSFQYLRSDSSTVNSFLDFLHILSWFVCSPLSRKNPSDFFFTFVRLCPHRDLTRSLLFHRVYQSRHSLPLSLPLTIVSSLRQNLRPTYAGTSGDFSKVENKT